MCPKRGRGRGNVAENYNASVASNAKETRERDIHLKDYEVDRSEQGVLDSCERSEEVC